MSEGYYCPCCKDYDDLEEEDYENNELKKAVNNYIRKHIYENALKTPSIRVLLGILSDEITEDNIELNRIQWDLRRKFFHQLAFVFLTHPSARYVWAEIKDNDKTERIQYPLYRDSRFELSFDKFYDLQEKIIQDDLTILFTRYFKYNIPLESAFRYVFFKYSQEEKEEVFKKLLQEDMFEYYWR